MDTTRLRSISLLALTLLWITLIFFARFATAADNAYVKLDPIYLSYDDAAKLALDENADLEAVRAQEEALKLQSKQALAPNNPVLTFLQNDTPGFNPGIQPAANVYQLNFTLGFPGKALAASAALKHQAEATREQAIAKEINILVSLSNIYVSFAINDIFYRLLLDELKRDQNLLKLLEKKFSASQAAKVDLLNAKVVVAKNQQDILVNRNELSILTTQFRQLIRRPDQLYLFPRIPKEILVPDLNLTFDELSRMMLKNQHLLIAAEKTVESAHSSLTAASLAALPDFQLMTAMNIYNVTNAQPIINLSRDYSFGLGIAIPLFFPFSELTGIRAAHQTLNAAEAQAQSQRLSAIAELQNTYTSLKAANLELDNLVKLVVPAAKSSYDLTLLTYSLGKADYFVLNESRRTWLESQKDLLSKRQSTAQLFNQFIQDVGCDFTKREGPHACER